ncbi:MAG: GyrI-like domain-containing protein [Pseudomonadota bacterium]
MPDYIVETIGETPYLYATGESSMDPAAISAAMGECYGRVVAFMESHGIPPAGPALSVYHTYDPEVMRFQAGIIVSSEAIMDPGADVKGDILPAGRVLSFTHVGPYATLRDDYADMMSYVEREGLKLSSPAWEVYIDDPKDTPEAELRTKVHVALE